METRVKEVRKHLGMTQTEFGDALGVSRDVINSYERGRVTPTQTFLDLLCMKYGVDPIWMETGEGEMFHKPSEAERFAELAAKIQSDPNEFKKRVFYALSLMSDEGWAAFEQAWNESEKKEKDTE
jgi:transcriptional regulator with XRE-family HTH domain